MRILKRLQAACIVFALAGSVHGQQLAQLAPTVAFALHRAGIPEDASTIYVREVNNGPVLLAMNETVPFNPASTMKLVTSDAALELLGPTFTWKTQAYVNGRQIGDVLDGDLIIKGSGDPKLVLESLWMFLRRIRERGIREIRGDLVLDRSVFAPADYDPAQFDNDPLQPYNVGPDGLLFNFKSLGFRFTPEPGTSSVKVTVDPPLAAYPVYPPILSNGSCDDWHNRLLPAIDEHGARFTGSYPASCGERTWYIHPYPMSHPEYFHLAFRRLWADLGGTLKGQMRTGVVPQTAVQVAEWESPPLAEVIRDINKYSNNVMARQLLLTLVNGVMNLPATPDRGAAIVRKWLNDKGIGALELSIENGSGLSRTERISASTMGRILGAAFQSPTMPEFIASLPLVGLDGTMRKRLTDNSVAGRAHIKTGSLDEVRAIAGYVLAASGKRYVVVSMINHANAARGREALDALLQWVYDRG